MKRQQAAGSAGANLRPKPQAAKRARSRSARAGQTIVTPTPASDGERRKAKTTSSDRPLRKVIGYVRRHPVASGIIVLTAGALVTVGIRTGLPLRLFTGAGAKLRGLRIPQRLPALLERPRQPLRRIGAAGMEVATSPANGANRTFKVNWKRQPADASEKNWPTDEVELGNKRADGGRADFRFMWKILPPHAPTATGRFPGDSPLGATAIELETTRPDGRTTGVNFRWRKLSVEEQVPDPTPDGTPDAVESA